MGRREPASGSELAGEVRLCERAAGCGESPAEGGVQDLVHARGRHKVQLRPDVGGDLLQVLLIARGEDDTLQACPMGRKHFVLDPAHLRETTQLS